MSERNQICLFGLDEKCTFSTYAQFGKKWKELRKTVVTKLTKFCLRMTYNRLLSPKEPRKYFYFDEFNKGAKKGAGNRGFKM